MLFSNPDEILEKSEQYTTNIRVGRRTHTRTGIVLCVTSINGVQQVTENFLLYQHTRYKLTTQPNNIYQ